jgi:hypothetical protein
MRVCRGAHLVIAGTQNGSLHVEDTGTVVVHGAQNGSVHVDAGAIVRVDAGGRINGSLHVSGRIENAGTRGGTVRLRDHGEVVDLPGSTALTPQVMPDGTRIYRS